MIALLALVVAAVALLAVLADGDERPIEAETPSTPTALAGLGRLGGSASGTVRLRTRNGRTSVALSITRLPRRAGHYEVWLYNSVIDSVALGRVTRSRREVLLPLPSTDRAYALIDISYEPPDGNSFHSGRSVLRMSLSALRG